MSACLLVCMSAMYMQYLQKPEESVESPGTDLTNYVGMGYQTLIPVQKPEYFRT